jgi:hypothetical protein
VDLTLLIAIGGIAVLVLLLVLLVLSRIKVAGPNQAFIVTGRQGREVTSASGVTSRDASGQKVVMGASVFVLPVVQKLHTMDLSSRRIPVGIRGAVSKQGVKADLEGVAIVKVGGTEDSIRAAAQRVLNQQDGIDTFTSEVLAGALRSIVGRLTIEEIIRDPARWAPRSRRTWPRGCSCPATSPGWTSPRCCAGSVARRPPRTAPPASRSRRPTGKSPPADPCPPRSSASGCPTRRRGQPDDDDQRGSGAQMPAKWCTGPWPEPTPRLSPASSARCR